MSTTATKLKNECGRLSNQNLQVLVDMYDSEELVGTEAGSPFKIDRTTRISFQQGATMHRLVSENEVTRSLEIGFAYGFSTVWILDALRDRPSALHLAIDPFEKSAWHGVGLAQVARTTTSARFEWVPDLSIHAVPALLKQDEKFDFVYIDGNHRFDDVLVDFYLTDQVTRVGGLIVFDDMWMDSVHTVHNFVVSNRGYELVRQSEANISVLRKVRDDDRPWNNFEPFAIGRQKNSRRGKGIFERVFGG